MAYRRDMLGVVLMLWGLEYTTANYKSCTEIYAFCPPTSFPVCAVNPESKKIAEFPSLCALQRAVCLGLTDKLLVRQGPCPNYPRLFRTANYLTRELFHRPSTRSLTSINNLIENKDYKATFCQRFFNGDRVWQRMYGRKHFECPVALLYDI